VGDNEVAAGLAPEAKIYFYTSAPTGLSSGLLNAIFRALDDNTVSILTASFHTCEADLGTSGNQVILESAEQAAAQGITRVNSSDDGGSAGCDNFGAASQATLGFAVNGLASPPYTVAAGGSDFDVLPSSFGSYVNASFGSPPYYRTALGYIPENPWNNSTTTNTTLPNNVAYVNDSGFGNIIAGGGGVSSVYAKPAYQVSLTPNDGFRDLPDISLLAGDGMYRTGWLVCDATDCQPAGSALYANSGVARQLRLPPLPECWRELRRLTAPRPTTIGSARSTISCTSLPGRNTRRCFTTSPLAMTRCLAHLGRRIADQIPFLPAITPDPDMTLHPDLAAWTSPRWSVTGPASRSLRPAQA
jgi:hypothetical protein